MNLIPCFSSRMISGTFCCLVAVLTALPAAAQGPGLAQPTGIAPGTQIATWDLSPGSSTRTTTAGFHRGYMFSDTRGGHGVQVYDVSNWSNVRDLGRFGYAGTNHTHFLIGDYYLNASGSGLQATLLDFSNMLNIVPESPNPPPDFPFLRRGDGNKRRDWFALPYIYTGQNGYHPPQPLGEIVDARTGEVMATLDYEGDLGFPGQPLTVGNLLIVAASQSSSGVATYDVTDPRNPVLLDVIRNTSGTFIGPGYEPSIWKHYVVLAMDDFGNSNDRVTFIDFSDPENLRLALTINGPPGLSRYTQFQDGSMFVGDAKYDVEAMMQSSRTVFDGRNDAELIFNGEDEYLLPLGNVLATFDTSGGTVRVIVHDQNPDITPPPVAYHLPADGAVNQSTGTRIGLVINETLDANTLNNSTLQVRPLGGSPISGTIMYTDKDVVNFHPSQPLEDNTTYEVVLLANGVRDATGNALTEDFSFRFSTGATLADVNQPPEITTLGVPYPVVVGQTRTLNVVAEDPEAEGPLEYQWDFGGADSAPWTPTNSASHTFDETGHITVVVGVRDAHGLITRQTVRVTVVPELAPVNQSRSSAPILFDAARDRVWVVNPDNDSVAAVSADTLQRVQEIPVERNPETLTLDGQGRLWIAAKDSDRIQVLDPDTLGSDVLPLAYGSRPSGILYDGVGTVFVTLEGRGEVAAFSTATLLETGRAAVGPQPHALALDGSGTRLLVTRFLSPESHGEVWELDPATLGLLRTYTLLPNTDPERDTGNEGRGLPNMLEGIAIDPWNREAWIPAQKVNIYRGLKRDGQLLTHDLTIRAISGVLDLEAGTDAFDQRVDHDNSSQPSAAWFTPLADYAFVLMQGNNEIHAIDRLDGNQLTTRILTGLAPTGMCYDPVRERLFTKDFMDRTLSVFPLGDFLSKGRVPVVRSHTVATVSAETLSPQVLAGKQIFYNADDDRMSKDDYINCASCHLDGGHDGMTYDFTQRGEGIRNNISLRGRAGMAHGLVHWSGNFDEIQDFENDIRTAFDGEGFLSDADWNDPEVRAPLGSKPKAARSAELDQLAAYLSSLNADAMRRSPYRNPYGKMTRQALRGREVFVQANCADCHSGASYRDGLRHNVGTLTPDSGMRLGGTLDGIDTPTLLDLHDTAPYLHDGSAATLADVFTRFDSSAPAGSDGRAHDLGMFTQAQREDLYRFLLELDGRNPPQPGGYVAQGGVVSMEVEDATFPGGQSIWQTVDTPLASGGQYVSSPQSNYDFPPQDPDPAAMFSFDFTLVEGGDYAFHVRVNSDTGADSMYWRLTHPDGSTTPWRRWLLQFNTRRSWDWRTWSTGSDNISGIGDEWDALSPGLYTLEVSYRENETWLDKFVVQKTSVPAPSGNAMGPEPTLQEAQDPEPETTGFQDWLAFHGFGVGTGFTQMLPEFGVEAGLAYAADWRQRRGDGPLRSRTETGGTASAEFTYYPTRDDIRVVVWASTTLSGWDQVAVSTPGTETFTELRPGEYDLDIAQVPGDPDAYRVQVWPMDGSTAFFRLQYEIITPSAP